MHESDNLSPNEQIKHDDHEDLKFESDNEEEQSLTNGSP